MRVGVGEGLVVALAEGGLGVGDREVQVTEGVRVAENEAEGVPVSVGPRVWERLKERLSVGVRRAVREADRVWDEGVSVAGESDAVRVVVADCDRVPRRLALGVGGVAEREALAVGLRVERLRDAPLCERDGEVSVAVESVACEGEAGEGVGEALGVGVGVGDGDQGGEGLGVNECVKDRGDGLGLMLGEGDREVGEKVGVGVGGVPVTVPEAVLLLRTVALRDAVPDAEAVPEGVGVGVSVGMAVGEAEALAVRAVLAVGDTLRVCVGVGPDGVLERVGVGVAEALRVRVGLALPVRVRADQERVLALALAALALRLRVAAEGDGVLRVPEAESDGVRDAVGGVAVPLPLPLPDLVPEAVGDCVVDGLREGVGDGGLRVPEADRV